MLYPAAFAPRPVPEVPGPRWTMANRDPARFQVVGADASGGDAICLPGHERFRLRPPLEHVIEGEEPGPAVGGDLGPTHIKVLGLRAVDQLGLDTILREGPPS